MQTITDAAVEKVARAINAKAAELEGSEDIFDTGSDQQRAFIMALGRAAIEAMREMEM
jgi:hypothetical protein